MSGMLNFMESKKGERDMTIEQAKEKLQKYGQEHVLKFYDELNEQERAELLAQIDATDFSVCENAKSLGSTGERGKFSPLKAMKCEEIEARREEFTKRGIEAIKAGKVAAVLLAGGMGTRLGSDSPKGMFDIGITHPVYIFERLITNLTEVAHAADAWPRLFIMTSEKNHDASVAFLTEHDFFGYPAERVAFFKQDMAPASDYDGKVFMESKSRIATSPNGNGGWFLSMKKAGLLPILNEEGIEWLNIFAVDNVLQRIADPCFIGATLDTGVEVGSKVIRKNARDERVGVMCLEDGHPSIVEYYELTDEMMDLADESGERVYNFGVILNYLFKKEALERVGETSLPLHVVEKKIPYMDADGNFVNPTEPNGCKYEQLALDLIRALDSSLPFEVVREKEFAPIKNRTGVDSVESARELCKKNGIEL